MFYSKSILSVEMKWDAVREISVTLSQRGGSNRRISKSPVSWAFLSQQHFSALSSQMYLSVNPPPLCLSPRTKKKILTLIHIFPSSGLPQSKPGADPEL